MTLLRVGIIGRGAIGGVIASEVASGRVEGATLSGVLRRDVRANDEVSSLDQLLDRGCDLIVEAAGHEALRRYAVAVLESGTDLVVLSAGALADPVTEDSVRAAGPGRLFVSTGAIGGLDIARAMVEAGALEAVSIRSTTTPEAVSDVADLDAGRYRLSDRGSSEPFVLLSGSAREVALAFPRLTNVAATVAMATLGLDEARAELRVDPSASHKRHELELVGPDSRVRVEIENTLAPDNPRTSAVTPYAVVRLLRDRVRPFVAGV